METLGARADRGQNEAGEQVRRPSQDTVAITDTAPVSMTKALRLNESTATEIGCLPRDRGGHRTRTVEVTVRATVSITAVAPSAAVRSHCRPG